MENKNIALVAHEMAKAAANRQAEDNRVVCLKAHYLNRFLEAQAAKKRCCHNCKSCTCCR